MYEAMCRHLRSLAKLWGVSTPREAADAIEELSKYANTIMRLKSEGWYLQQTKHHDCYEAISTMPLPEPPKEEAP